MHPRSSPSRILRRHAEDERPKFSAHRFSPTDLPGSGDPFPIEAKTRSMPLDHRSRRVKNQGSLPSRPEPPQDHPEQLVRGGEPTPWSFGVQVQQLLTERQILQHEIVARAERVQHPAGEVAKRCEHGRNLIARLALQPSYKQFVLDSHNILIRHSLTVLRRALEGARTQTIFKGWRTWAVVWGNVLEHMA